MINKNRASVSDLIEKAWSNEDKSKYRQMKKDIKSFNRRHFSTAKNILYAFLDVFLTVAPLLFGFLVYLTMVIFIDRLGKQLVTTFEKQDLINVSIAIVSISSTVYLSIVVGLVIGTNKGNDYFGKSENKMFWSTNTIAYFENFTWFFYASFMTLLSLLSFLMKDYAGLFSSSLFVIVYSFILLFSFLSYKNKNGKEKCRLYLQSFGFLKRKVRGLAIRENSLFRKYLKEKSSSKYLSSKITKLNLKTLGSLFYLISKAEEKALKDSSIKEEQNILEDFFSDYASTICSVSQAFLFVTLCKEYVDSFANGKMPKQNIKDTLLSRKSIIGAIKIAISSLEKSVAPFPLNFDDLPKVFLFKKDQIETTKDILTIVSYYSVVIEAYKELFECGNTIINGALKTHQPILRKEMPSSDINKSINAFVEKYDRSEPMNNYLNERVKAMVSLVDGIKELSNQTTNSD